MISFDANVDLQAGVGAAPLEEAGLNPALQSETVMPIQFYSARRRGDRGEAVKRLMCAILEDALRCFGRNFEASTPVKRREFCEARKWLFRERGEETLFSFENVCDILGADPNRLRREMSERRTNVPAGRMPDPLFRRSPIVLKRSTSVQLGVRANRGKRQTFGRGE